VIEINQVPTRNVCESNQVPPIIIAINTQKARCAKEKKFSLITSTSRGNEDTATQQERYPCKTYIHTEIRFFLSWLDCNYNEGP